ncbi:ras family domain-containing protein [Ditylenchus destructor]|uniref:Ras family domain-containing protein n=1 Tax=Ditylenchus destructor TaxID=166010 RepID=A0AAD4R883_9BILA|nr:ras family domain-containing protein [Ditylenchus destructor]
MTRVYYRDSHGAIIVYDVKRHETLNGAFRWKKDLDSKLLLDDGQPIPSVLVANKCDLDNNVTEHELADYAKQGGFRAAFKISAKTGLSVDSTLDYLIRSVVSAEKDGLYMMPMIHRDNQIHRLSYDEDSRKKRSLLKNICC